jgi:hypothetical protein
LLDVAVSFDIITYASAFVIEAIWYSASILELAIPPTLVRLQLDIVTKSPSTAP